MTYANHWRLFRGAAEGRGILFHRIVMLFCMAVFLLLSGVLSGAEKKERKVVRIPVFPFERMMILDEDNNPMSGYAYEYIQTIAAYAGWDIEYDPCDSFSEALNKLFAGSRSFLRDQPHRGTRQDHPVPGRADGT